jgi:hypothetical protein
MVLACEQAKTLLSPLGLSPGLLYSALMTIKPQRLVVLTSDQSAAGLREIIEKAAFTGSIAVVKVTDPFNCFAEAGEMTTRILNLLVDDRPQTNTDVICGQTSECQITVNLTGGTTALQFIIQRAGSELERSDHEVSYIALVDRRGVTAQRENPWVVGELIEVI